MGAPESTDELDDDTECDEALASLGEEEQLQQLKASFRQSSKELEKAMAVTRKICAAPSVSVVKPVVPEVLDLEPPAEVLAAPSIATDRNLQALAIAGILEAAAAGAMAGYEHYLRPPGSPTMSPVRRSLGQELAAETPTGPHVLCDA